MNKLRALVIQKQQIEEKLPQVITLQKVDFFPDQPKHKPTELYVNTWK